MGYHRAVLPTNTLEFKSWSAGYDGILWRFTIRSFWREVNC